MPTKRALPHKSSIKMKKHVKIVFPFQIENEEMSYRIETEIERKESMVSFSLPYKMVLRVATGSVLTIKDNKRSFVYVIEFDELSGAIDFSEDPCVHAIEEVETKDVNTLSDEMTKFMVEYEKAEGKDAKKRKYVDEEGFVHVD
jgi:hypothetical protein